MIFTLPKRAPRMGRDGFQIFSYDPLTSAMIGLLPTPHMGQQGFNPFRPMLPNWGAGGYWDQQNQFGQQRALLSQAQAPERQKMELLAGILGPNGPLGKFLSNLGGMGMGGMGGGPMMGMQSVNSPQAFSLGPLFNQMAR